MSAINIDFFTVNASPPLKNKKKIKNWIIRLIQQEKNKLAYINVTIIFCNDQYLLELNEKFLKKDTLTDILSFEYSENNSLEGDIYISIERIIENAEKFGQTKENELLRIMAHGVLHLCGYKDKTKQDKKIMTERENFYLSELKTVK